MMQLDFDDIVVGNGLLGAAAALELTQLRRRVCLIGAQHGAEGRVFSGHDDDSRMLRLYHADSYWEDMTRLNLQMMREMTPGCTDTYFTPTPVRFRGLQQSDSAYSLQSRRTAGNPLLDAFDIEDEFGGIVNPLQYIASMNSQSEVSGMIRLNGVVRSVRQLANGCEVETNRGRFTARRVLHASGFHAAADINALQMVGKVVLFATRPEADRGPVECFIDGSPGSTAFSDVYGFCDYRLGPDGSVSKFGFSEVSMIQLEPDQISDWFTGGYLDHPLLAEMRAWVLEWSAGLVQVRDFKPCAFATTHSKRPGLWRAESQYWLAGCNGMAAKCCQAVARSAVVTLEPDAFPDFPVTMQMPEICRA